MPARRDSRSIDGARYVANWDTQVDTYTKRWTHWGGPWTVLQKENALWLDMPFFRSTEKRGYIVHVAEILTHYEDVLSGSLPVASLNRVAFDKIFNLFHVFSHFDYCVKETVFERRLKARGDSCCFNNRHSVDVYAVSSLARLALLVPIREWWRLYERSRLFFVPTRNMTAYYSNIVVSRRATELIFRVAISNIFVYVFISSLLSKIVSRPGCFISAFTGVEDTAGLVVLFQWPEVDHNYLQSFGSFWIVVNCTANSVRAFMPIFDQLHSTSFI